MNSDLSDRSRWKNQQGVTLVEIAVVMVIAGLLMGTGLLMSQSLIRGMHAKEAQTLIQDLSTGARYFKEKYHYLPGDLPLAGNDILGVSSDCDIDPNGATPNTYIGNGIIDTAVEEKCAIEHLSVAGFIKHDHQESILRGRFGTVRITANHVHLTDPANDYEGSEVRLPSSILNVIELANLPWDIAIELDQNLDDGNLVDPSDPAPADPTAEASVILAGTLQVDVDPDTAGNQGPADMVNAIPYLAVPL
jgi:prepilin-type N-terminal cleavage/methylation domain-containing protein